MSLSCPSKITAHSGIESLVHAIEGYTSKYSTPMSDIFGIEAIKLIYKNIRTAYYNGENFSARSALSLGSLYAGICFAQSGCGGAHALVLSLGSYYNVSHGISTALILPEIMNFNLFSSISKYASIAKIFMENLNETTLLTQDKLAKQTINYFKYLMKDLDMPIRLREINVKKESLDVLGKTAVKNIRLISNNPRKISEKDAINIFKKIY